MAETAGTLVIADRAIARIAEHTALTVDGVVRHRGAVGSVLGSTASGLMNVGGDLPSISVDSIGTARRLSVEVALVWPCAITAVCARIREAVADELERCTGDRPIRVDVTVDRLVPRGEVVRRKQGYIDLPPVDEIAHRDEEVEDDRVED